MIYRCFVWLYVALLDIACCIDLFHWCTIYVPCIHIDWSSHHIQQKHTIFMCFLHDWLTTFGKQPTTRPNWGYNTVGPNHQLLSSMRTMGPYEWVTGVISPCNPTKITGDGTHLVDNVLCFWIISRKLEKGTIDKLIHWRMAVSMGPLGAMRDTEQTNWCQWYHYSH